MKTIIILFLSVGFFLQIASAGETSTYSFSWLDPDKEVFVLQNRKFRKAGRMYANLGGGITTSGAFVDATAIQARAGYFFREEWGFEVIYSKNNGDENDTAATLRNDGGAGSTPFRRIVDSYYGAMILWAPFYTKINTFNTILYFDWIIGLGYGQVSETNNKNEFLTGGIDKTETSEDHGGIIWNIGTKFFINERFSLRVDYTSMNYRAEKASNTSSENKWYNNYDLTASVGLDF